MRKLTLGVLAAGCLLLGLITFIAPDATTPISVTVSAQSLCTQPCSFGDPGAKDKADHFAFCHVDHGGEAHVICPDSSSIDTPHLSTHQFDFCINTVEDLDDCIKKSVK
jgi:hypothetical protein